MDKPAGDILERIIEGCRKEQRSSQHALYKMFYSYGMSICFRYATDEQEAIGILNEAFLKVFDNLKQFDPEKGAFKSWFRVILVNTAINHVKKQQKFKLEVAMDEAMEVRQQDDILSRIGYKELIAMVQSLSVAYRTVFNLYVIDGFKHEEIAQQLGITVSTSKSNLARAKARLRDMIQEKLKAKYA
jgi:RNA polymerase sigma-70 factor (ECF subfamily)